MSFMQQIQEQSTKLLNFYVGDLLCLAQIEKGILKKDITSFNIKTAIDEVINVQLEKILSKQNEVQTEFIGF